MKNNYVVFDKEKHLKPDFKKSDFDSLSSWDFGWALLEPINTASDKESEIELAKMFSPGQKALYFFWYLDGEVSNGGFIQFFWNENQKYLPAILDGLQLVGDEKMIKIVEKATNIYQANKEKFGIENSQENFEKLYYDLVDFEELDTSYFDLHDNSMELIEKYARENQEQFINLK